MKLIIDSRENSNLYEYVESEAHRLLIITEKQWLEIGDYVFSDMVFECKSAVDFLQSIINKRLWNQIDNMDRHYEHSFVIIHGSLKDALKYNKFVKMNIPHQILVNKFYGGIGKISLDTDCSVLWFENEQVAAKVIVTLCKMRPIDRKVISPSLLKRITTEDLRVNLLCSIKGVSETKAKKLIEAYGSIMEIGEAPIGEMTNIDGLGLSVAERIHDVLNSENKQVI
tara:strand:+ start:956 stop:1633 length:678 start_codon:yes stop_codon:yes gene_type:complete